MPEEFDIRKDAKGNYEIYLAGRWWKAAELGPGGATLLAMLVAQEEGGEGVPPQEEGREPPTGEGELDIEALLEGMEEPEKVVKELWATRAEAAAVARQETADSGVEWEAYRAGTDAKRPFAIRPKALAKPEALAEPEYATDAQGNTWVRTSAGGAWQRAPEPTGVPPGGWPGQEQAAPRQQSIDDMITEALVSGDSDRALALDEFRQRPSSFQLAQFAQSIATSPQDFLAVYQALQDAQQKSFAALGGGKGFAGAVSPDQAAQLVERMATGQVGAAPPTPPGFAGAAASWAPPTPPPVVDGGFAGYEVPKPPPGASADDWDRYYSQVAVAQAQARQQQEQPKGGLWGKQPGEPGYEAQQAMEYAQKIGGQGVQALPEGKGFVADISNLTPQQMQSQFGPMAGPSQSDIEGLSDEELMKYYNITPEERRRRLKAKVGGFAGQSAFAQTVAGFLGRPKYPTPGVTATRFVR